LNREPTDYPAAPIVKMTLKRIKSRELCETFDEKVTLEVGDDGSITMQSDAKAPKQETVPDGLDSLLPILASHPEGVNTRQLTTLQRRQVWGRRRLATG
jgi:hypothetical protein